MDAKHRGSRGATATSDPTFVKNKRCDCGIPYKYHVYAADVVGL